MFSFIIFTTLFLCLSIVCFGKDPAQGWLGYAEGVNPSGGNARITSIEAYWQVPSNPKVNGAFFSPWFGIEASDNLNLIQPVNPWSGSSWEIYNEYYQWTPTYNYNSKSHTVNAGDVVYGKVTFNEADETYTMYHSDLNDGWSVTSVIDVQKASNGDYKNYTIIYFVMEKEWACNQYPPDNQVTFYDIIVQYEGETVSPKWTTSYVDDVCNCRAHILNETTIQITWQS